MERVLRSEREGCRDLVKSEDLPMVTRFVQPAVNGRLIGKEKKQPSLHQQLQSTMK